MPYRDPAAQREYQRQWKAARRGEWLSDKVCARCGTSERLEIHHRDSSEKVDHKVWSWAKQRRDTELAKCEVVCRDCHEDEHWPRSMPRSPILFAQVREAEKQELIDRQRRLHRRSKA